MKLITTIICLFIFVFSLFAQKTDEVLATANGKNFTAQNLSPEAQKLWQNLPKSLAGARTELFAQQISDLLLEAEAAARKTNVEKLVEAELKAKVADPPAAQIQAVYDANRDKLGSKTLSEVRAQIVAFLRREPEQKALMNFVTELKTKYKPVFGKDVNAPNLKPSDVLATVSGKQITYKDFEDKNKLTLYEFEAEAFEHVIEALRESVYSDLLTAEAEAQKVAPSDIVAREVTNKMRDYSNEEIEALQSALQNRLFTKYNAKFLLKEPVPIAQNVTADDDPALGKTDAPVTVVMFSDFQCPACAAVHPILKKITGEYGDKVRFVVRDFPLAMHENAFLAAQAANAANAQGKFFEYSELLYNNQNSLDAASLKELATRINLDRKRFDADLDGEKFADEVRKDMADGNSYGITGTPTIFVNGVKIRHLSVTGFRTAIERALKK